MNLRLELGLITFLVLSHNIILGKSNFTYGDDFILPDIEYESNGLINTVTISIPFPDTNGDINLPCSGCTHTIGYWKTHAGFTGNNPDNITTLLGKEGIWLGTAGAGKSVRVTSASDAVNLLEFMGKASNGINKLYAKLLAAKLNIANGASPKTISTTLVEADSELELHNSEDWTDLNKAPKDYINQLAAALDDYNNGLTGPPLCSESSEQEKLLMTSPQSTEKDTGEKEEDSRKNNICFTINLTINNSSNFRIYFNENEGRNKE